MAAGTDLGPRMHFQVLSRAAVVQKSQGLPSTLLHDLRRCNYHSCNPYLRGREDEALPLGRPPELLVCLESWGGARPPTTWHTVTFAQTKPVLSLTASGARSLPPEPAIHLTLQMLATGSSHCPRCPGEEPYPVDFWCLLSFKPRPGHPRVIVGVLLVFKEWPLFVLG